MADTYWIEQAGHWLGAHTGTEFDLRRFDGRTPLDVLATEAGARLWKNY